MAGYSTLFFGFIQKQNLSRAFCLYISALLLSVVLSSVNLQELLALDSFMANCWRRQSPYWSKGSCGMVKWYPLLDSIYILSVAVRRKWVTAKKSERSTKHWTNMSKVSICAIAFRLNAYCSDFILNTTGSWALLRKESFLHVGLLFVHPQFSPYDHPWPKGWHNRCV